MNTKTTIKASVKKVVNWALPSQSITISELTNAISEAEKGSFNTVQESMKNFDKWLISRKKQ